MVEELSPAIYEHKNAKGRQSSVCASGRGSEEKLATITRGNVLDRCRNHAAAWGAARAWVVCLRGSGDAIRSQAVPPPGAHWMACPRRAPTGRRDGRVHVAHNDRNGLNPRCSSRPITLHRAVVAIFFSASWLHTRRTIATRTRQQRLPF